MGPRTLLGLMVWTVGCAGPDGMFVPDLDSKPRRQGRYPLPEYQLTEVELPRKAPEIPGLWHSPRGLVLNVRPEVYSERSVEGRTLPYWTLGSGEKTALILGAIHGDEQSSSDLAYEFLAWALQNPGVFGGTRVVIAPLVNPDGYAHRTRANLRGVDLNRNFPAENFRASHEHGPFPGSEPESRFLLSLLRQFQPDVVVSIHGAARCVNWDGPAEELARRMGELCRLPPMANIGYPTPGSLGTYIGTNRGVPIITLELPDNHDLGPYFYDYRRALQAAIAYPHEVVALGK